MTKRIWELDALRGLCIVSMVLLHLSFDLGLPLGQVMGFVMDWGGTVFVILSGICVTLGSRHIKRGLVVLCFGILCTLVTSAMARLGFLEDSLVIRFGILHCLGSCMLLWSILKRLPGWALTITGAGLSLLGLWFTEVVTVQTPWLFPLGLTTAQFASGDYFPLLPFLGFFLLGAALGRRLYRQKRSLLPGANDRVLPLRFLCFCGRHSLLIYLLHQPILTAIVQIIS